MFDPEQYQRDRDDRARRNAREAWLIITAFGLLLLWFLSTKGF